MAFTQNVMTCQAAADAGLTLGEMHNGAPQPDCIAIVCTNDATGDVVWHSHDSATIDPATRLNPSVPAKDYR